MPNYVAGFLVSEAGLIALVLKSKPEWQKGLWNGIGGKIEDGETPHQAMVREFEEETGLSTCESDWTHRVTLSFDGGKVYFFLARSPVSPVLPAFRREEPVSWHLLDALPKNVIPNLRWLVPLCLDTDLAVPIEIEDVSTTTTGAAAREKAEARLDRPVAAPPAARRPAYRYQITVREVIDGDTLRADVALGFHTTVTTSLRLIGVNCPELNTPEGLAARDFVRRAVDECQRVLIADTVKPDKYGDRWNATVWLSDLVTLNDLLVTRGHAVRVGPGGSKE